MTDKQFADLKTELEQTMNKLDRLQRIYRGQTGRDYVRGISLKGFMLDCMEAERGKYAS
jgi:hypothetical protein